MMRHTENFNPRYVIMGPNQKRTIIDYDDRKGDGASTKF